jgi:hypothetical protein
MNQALAMSFRCMIMAKFSITHDVSATSFTLLAGWVVEVGRDSERYLKELMGDRFFSSGG